MQNVSVVRRVVPVIQCQKQINQPRSYCYGTIYLKAIKAKVNKACSGPHVSTSVIDL